MARSYPARSRRPGRATVVAALTLAVVAALATGASEDVSATVHGSTAVRPYVPDGAPPAPPSRRGRADRCRPRGGRLHVDVPPLRPAVVARSRRASAGRAPWRPGLGHPVRAEHGLRRPRGGERLHRGVPGRDADGVRTRPAGLERRGVLWVGGGEPVLRGRRRLHPHPHRRPRVDLPDRPGPCLRHGALERCAPRVRSRPASCPRWSMRSLSRPARRWSRVAIPQLRCP